jgi:hypothetical protein
MSAGYTSSGPSSRNLLLELHRDGEGQFRSSLAISSASSVANNNKKKLNNSIFTENLKDSNSNTNTPTATNNSLSIDNEAIANSRRRNSVVFSKKDLLSINNNNNNNNPSDDGENSSAPNSSRLAARQSRSQTLDKKLSAVLTELVNKRGSDDDEFASNANNSSKSDKTSNIMPETPARGMSIPIEEAQVALTNAISNTATSNLTKDKKARAPVRPWKKLTAPNNSSLVNSAAESSAPANPIATQQMEAVSTVALLAGRYADGKAGPGAEGLREAIKKGERASTPQPPENEQSSVLRESSVNNPIDAENSENEPTTINLEPLEGHSRSNSIQVRPQSADSVNSLSNNAASRRNVLSWLGSSSKGGKLGNKGNQNSININAEEGNNDSSSDEGGEGKKKSAVDRLQQSLQRKSKRITEFGHSVAHSVSHLLKGKNRGKTKENGRLANNSGNSAHLDPESTSRAWSSPAFTHETPINSPSNLSGRSPALEQPAKGGNLPTSASDNADSGAEKHLSGSPKSGGSVSKNHNNLSIAAGALLPPENNTHNNPPKNSFKKEDHGQNSANNKNSSAGDEETQAAAAVQSDSAFSSETSPPSFHLHLQSPAPVPRAVASPQNHENIIPSTVPFILPAKPALDTVGELPFSRPPLSRKGSLTNSLSSDSVHLPSGAQHWKRASVLLLSPMTRASKPLHRTIEGGERDNSPARNQDSHNNEASSSSNGLNKTTPPRLLIENSSDASSFRSPLMKTAPPTAPSEVSTAKSHFSAIALAALNSPSMSRSSRPAIPAESAPGITPSALESKISADLLALRGAVQAQMGQLEAQLRDIDNNINSIGVRSIKSRLDALEEANKAKRADPLLETRLSRLDNELIQMKTAQRQNFKAIYDQLNNSNYSFRPNGGLNQQTSPLYDFLMVLFTWFTIGLATLVQPITAIWPFLTSFFTLHSNNLNSSPQATSSKLIPISLSSTLALGPSSGPSLSIKTKPRSIASVILPPNHLRNKNFAGSNAAAALLEEEDYYGGSSPNSSAGIQRMQGADSSTASGNGPATEKVKHRTKTKKLNVK